MDQRLPEVSMYQQHSCLQHRLSHTDMPRGIKTSSIEIKFLWSVSKMLSDKASEIQTDWLMLNIPDKNDAILQIDD